MRVIEYTPEFEVWWATEKHKYENNVGVLTEMFKEVSFNAWDEAYDKGRRDGYEHGYDCGVFEADM